MVNQGFDNSLSRLILNWYGDNSFGVNISDDHDILVEMPRHLKTCKDHGDHFQKSMCHQVTRRMLNGAGWGLSHLRSLASRAMLYTFADIPGQKQWS
ncbi:hypothetical protein RRG08_055898 [Elysia crispata]|uniref:Uncharacterized protein n=1 Tax=Elysia crispata TaxID=231223 RepID=A0AAE0Y469_9GAST|nr:hypothetical protein RRG08_055898 [Elysia crispata]